jgi:hypothetical protein
MELIYPILAVVGSFWAIANLAEAIFSTKKEPWSKRLVVIFLAGTFLWIFWPEFQKIASLPPDPNAEIEHNLECDGP